MKGKRPNGWPPVLTKGKVEVIRKEIMKLHSKWHYPTYDEIWDFVYFVYLNFQLNKIFNYPKISAFNHLKIVQTTDIKFDIN